MSDVSKVWIVLQTEHMTGHSTQAHIYPVLKTPVMLPCTSIMKEAQFKI